MLSLSAGVVSNGVCSCVCPCINCKTAHRSWWYLLRMRYGVPWWSDFNDVYLDSYFHIFGV